MILSFVPMWMIAWQLSEASAVPDMTLSQASVMEPVAVPCLNILSGGSPARAFGR